MKIRNFVYAVTATVSMAFVAPAFADDISLTDILLNKGVLSKDEAKLAKKSEKKHSEKLKIGGRIQADFAVYDDNDPVVDFSNGAEFRRARLYAKGKFDDFKYKAQFDFAGNSTTIKDLYVQYTGAPVNIKIGNFKEPFSLEELTSSKYITFMERALPNVFAPSRKMGLAFSGHGDAWSAATGVFTNSAGGTTAGIDSSIDLTGRLTYAPIHEKTRAIHFGAGLSNQQTSSANTLSIRQRPESHITHKRLVATGTMTNVDSLLKYNLELAAVLGAFSVQGEYFGTNVSYKNSVGNDPTFTGYYVLGSWFLTGESRPYSAKKGTFGRVKPNQDFKLHGGGWGAWEIATRFSELDLEDQLITGGVERNISVALNWYPRKNVRWMFNWVNASVDRSPLSTVATQSFDVDTFQMRVQLDF